MQLFKNILVVQAADHPVSAALRIAARLSRHTGSRAKVVDVRRDDDRWWKEFLNAESFPLSAEGPEQVDSLNELVDQLDMEPDAVHVKILQGRPIDALVNEALAGRHDLILKDAESEAENLFLGSLDLRLLRLAPTPVWIANPTVPGKTRRILAAIDPHVRDEGMKLNKRIICLASRLARLDEAELHVVSGWDMPAAKFERHSEGHQRYEDAKTRVRKFAWENVEHVVDTSLVRISPSQVTFEFGTPSETIVEAVQQVQPDLLVMGTVARRGIPGLWIGNTAEEVTRQIECSVLTIKPDDFTFLLPIQSRRG